MRLLLTIASTLILCGCMRSHFTAYTSTQFTPTDTVEVFHSVNPPARKYVVIGRVAVRAGAGYDDTSRLQRAIDEAKQAGGQALIVESGGEALDDRGRVTALVIRWEE